MILFGIRSPLVVEIEETLARLDIMVPYDAYARAARELVRPSSAARAIANGATAIERIDRLVLNLMSGKGLDTSLVEPVVSLIDQRLAANRSQN